MNPIKVRILYGLLSVLTVFCLALSGQVGGQVSSGGVAAPAGDTFCSTCTGSGTSPSFCWEVATDTENVSTDGGCVISGGDASATANSAVDITSAPTGKSGYAVTWSTSADYYAFDVSSDDLVDDTAGTVVFDFYVTTFYNYTCMFMVRALSGEDELYVEIANTDELRLYHEGSNAGVVSATTSGADLQLNTWYTCTAKWRTGDQSGNPTLSITANNVTATSSTTLTAFTNQPGSGSLMIGNPGGNTNGASVKNIKIYKAWVE